MVQKIKFTELEVRRRVYAFKNLHPDQPKRFIVNHFLEQGIAKSTIYDILKRAENDFEPERKVGSGRKPRIMTPKAISKLKKMCNH